MLPFPPLLADRPANMRSSFILSTASLAVSVGALPAAPGKYPPSYNDTKGGESKEEAKYRANAVMETFETAWNGYYKLVLQLFLWRTGS